MRRPYNVLFILPFDHRSSFEKDLFKIFDRDPTPNEAVEISKYKNIIFDGFKQAIESGVAKENAGILVDEQFGFKILSEAKEKGFWVACSVEKSGQEEFEFEYGLNFKQHLLKIQPDFVKVLVRFNPQGNEDLNKRQTLRLKTLSDFCVKNHFYLMLELLVPATVDQLSQVGSDRDRYDIEIRPQMMIEAIEALQKQGIEPHIWKVEGVSTLKESLKLAQQAQKNLRSHVRLIVLGRGKGLKAIEEWLTVAADTPGFIGFAVGRTVWEQALKLYLVKEITSEQASQMIATNFKMFCDLWTNRKQIQKSNRNERRNFMIEKTMDLSKNKVDVKKVYRNLAPARLYEFAILESTHGKQSAISSQGALIAYSGAKTGRSPLDKRIVKEENSEKNIWWGKINIALSEMSFESNLDLAVNYLNTREQLYVIDGYAGWRPEHRIKVRVISARPYHALFMHNMLIRPTETELKNFGEPEWTIYNAGEFPASLQVEGMTSESSIDLNLKKHEVVILGTEYAGCMKKAVFTILNYLLPAKGVLSMHCSANEGAGGDTAFFLGLSGTGKTTLSADPDRKLIGDDEHGWDDSGIFNIEGGCYAKTVDLTRDSEPEIWDAIRFGSVLENVVYNAESREVDFSDTSITENTRVAYPLEFINGAKIPAVGVHPKNIIFLTCDAFGVLPPVSKLDPAQAMYHFMSGYSAKVAGTEQGVNTPTATFSACFGSAFMVWNPMKYAELLKNKMKKHNVNVWLLNTGWTGGAPGVGKRIELKHTRAMVNAILNGSLEKSQFNKDPVFSIAVPQTCPEVPSDLLIPKKSWKDKGAYDIAAQKLSQLFKNNFEQFSDQPGSVEIGARLDPDSGKKIQNKLDHEQHYDIDGVTREDGKVIVGDVSRPLSD